jgi:transcriptional regulator GlxA family with amidase domain
MVVYMRRTGADPQLSPWLEGRNHLHPGLHRAQDAIAADPARPWTIPELAALANTSPRHLTRLFQIHAATSPLDYIHRLRVALARELLTSSTLDLERIAERSGFGSTRQLRRVWTKYHTMPPSRSRGEQAADGPAA